MSYGMDPITFEFADSLQVRIEVTDDGGKQNLSVAAEDNTAVFRFRNPEGLGVGYAHPVKFGTFAGKDIYATIRVSMHGEGTNQSYSLDYTFFLVADNNG